MLYTCDGICQYFWGLTVKGMHEPCINSAKRGNNFFFLDGNNHRNKLYVKKVKSEQCNDL